jgi:hypothetical protein
MKDFESLYQEHLDFHENLMFYGLVLALIVAG